MTDRASRLASAGPFFGLLARDGMVRLWHVYVFHKSGSDDVAILVNHAVRITSTSPMNAGSIVKSSVSLAPNQLTETCHVIDISAWIFTEAGFLAKLNKVAKTYSLMF